ncbi:protein FAM98B-like isoform X2 [Hylaeus volcanicus]|uniref:protein FAM98B-like isoform X2 n=1 Tax=Hylaeus volcanicus TaxID=313075 RepID=UPI0023B7CD2D|nr:protein FAM98B-like isoform X2 [Hylaeus volcanicus]
MELKLLDKLQKLGYNGELTDPNKFTAALKQGPKSPQFTKFVAWLTNEIAILYEMDETVHPTMSPEDSSSFLLELNCFLKELGCVNESLMSGNANNRLGSEENRYILLDFLGAELKTSRLLEFRKHKTSNSMDVDVEESDTAKDLKDMLIALNFGKPPDDITVEKLFTRLEGKLTEVLKKVPPELVGQPLITTEFTEREWKDLQLLQQELHDEYRMRRDMLLKRLDVTVQSFLWSDRVKCREAEINKQYEDTRKFLSAEPDITFADLLAARDDIALMEKTSNASVRKNTRSEINSVIIGTVPDRGGRPYEQEPPPPEMPPWQKDRVQGPTTSGGGRGGGGGYRGRGGGGSNASFSNDNRGGQKHGSYGGGGSFGDSGSQSSNYSSNSSGFGGQGGGHGGKHGGGYGGHGGGQGGGYGGNYGGGQGGGYGGGQGGNYGGGQGGNYGGGQGGNYGGSQGGNYGGGQGGNYGGGQGGNYGGGQGGNYGGGQGGNYRGQGGNNSYGGENKDSGGSGHRYCYPSNASSGSQSDNQRGQQYQGGGSSGGGRGGRVQGGWNQGNNSSTDNYQRGGYNRGRGRGGRQY